MNKESSFWDYIILLRPTLFVPVWTTFLIGHWFSHKFFDWKSWLGISIYTLMMGGVYILNQIVDIESDRENKKLFLLSDGIIRRKNAFIYMLMLFMFTLPLSLFIGKTFFILFLLSLIVGVLYSLPPFQLKAKPILDLIANATGYGVLAFLSGFSVHSPTPPHIVLRTLPYFFAVSAVFVNTTIPDIPGDKQAGKITTGVLMGKKWTLFLGMLLDAISFILSIIFKDFICGAASLYSLPIFTIAFIKPTKRNILYSIRLTAPALTLISVLLYPFLLFFLLLVYFGQKYYYKRRFHINYPSITSGIESDF